MKGFLIRKYLDKDFDFFFGFFIGVILLVAISIVAFTLTTAFVADVEGYRDWFSKGGYEVKVNNSEYLDLLKKRNITLYTESEKGLNYDVTVSCGDRSVTLSFLRYGKVFLNLSEDFKGYAPIKKGEIYLSQSLCDELGGIEQGTELTIAGMSCRLAGTYYRRVEIPDPEEEIYFDGEKTVVTTTTINYSNVYDEAFILYADKVKPSSFKAVFTDMNDAIAFCDKVKDPLDLEDERGVLSYYKGMHFLRNVFIGFAVFVAFLYVLYYAVTMSIYMMRKARSYEILHAFGGSRGGYAFSVGACFSVVSLFGTAFGLLAALGLRRIIDYWASEMIGMTLDAGHIFLVFAAFVVLSVIVTGVITFVLSRRLNRDGTVFC